MVFGVCVCVQSVMDIMKRVPSATLLLLLAFCALIKQGESKVSLWPWPACVSVSKTKSLGSDPVSVIFVSVPLIYCSCP